MEGVVNCAAYANGHRTGDIEIERIRDVLAEPGGLFALAFAFWWTRIVELNGRFRFKDSHVGAVKGHG